jgi:hypothetical protein
MWRAHKIAKTSNDGNLIKKNIFRAWNQYFHYVKSQKIIFIVAVWTASVLYQWIIQSHITRASF